MQNRCIWSGDISSLTKRIEVERTIVDEHHKRSRKTVPVHVKPKYENDYYTFIANRERTKPIASRLLTWGLYLIAASNLLFLLGDLFAAMVVPSSLYSSLILIGIVFVFLSGMLRPPVDILLFSPIGLRDSQKLIRICIVGFALLITYFVVNTMFGL